MRKKKRGEAAPGGDNTGSDENPLDRRQSAIYPPAKSALMVVRERESGTGRINSQLMES
jgi:hypothetical protein